MPKLRDVVVRAGRPRLLLVGINPGLALGRARASFRRQRQPVLAAAACLRADARAHRLPRRSPARRARHRAHEPLSAHHAHRGGASPRGDRAGPGHLGAQDRPLASRRGRLRRRHPLSLGAGAKRRRSARARAQARSPERGARVRGSEPEWPQRQLSRGSRTSSCGFADYGCLWIASAVSRPTRRGKRGRGARAMPGKARIRATSISR